MKYYRVGAKQNRAILDEEGKQVALFEPGQEELAQNVCKALNADQREYAEVVKVRQPADIDLVIEILGIMNSLYDTRVKVTTLLGRLGEQEWMVIQVSRQKPD